MICLIFGLSPSVPNQQLMKRTCWRTTITSRYAGQLDITAAQRAMAQDRFSVKEDDLFPV